MKSGHCGLQITSVETTEVILNFEETRGYKYTTVCFMVLHTTMADGGIRGYIRLACL